MDWTHVGGKARGRHQTLAFKGEQTWQQQQDIIKQTTDLLKCSLTDTVVHNVQSSSISLQLSKDVRPTQTFSVYLVMKYSLKNESVAISETQIRTLCHFIVFN